MCIRDRARTIRVPVHMVETINKMSKMQRKLTLELGYEPSVTELAEALEMSEDKVMEIMQIAREPASLETPSGEEDDSNLGDFVADSNAVTPEGNVESVMLREHILSLIHILEQTVLDLKARGIRVFAAHLAGKNNYEQEDYTGNTAFLIGNEGNGLTEKLSDMADTLSLIHI